MNIRVYSFSGAYRQREYDFGRRAEVFDLTALPGTSCYADPALLADSQCPGSLRGAADLSLNGSVNFIDSGDYHYMTYLLTAKIDRPFSLVLIDNHPDSQIPAFGEDILSCGGWVRSMLRDNPFLQRVLIIGINPSLLSETEGLPSAEDGTPRATIISGFTEETAGEVSREQWFARACEQLKDWLEASEEPVYLSIDKDVLLPEYALTDWDQGTMTLPELLALCHQIKVARTIIGTDICGELAPSKGGTPEDALLNAKANKAIVEVL